MSVLSVFGSGEVEGVRDVVIESRKKVACAERT